MNNKQIMYNDNYLIKKIEEKVTEGAQYSSVGDSFAYSGEVVKIPLDSTHISVGDHVLFTKDTGEDVVVYGEKYKVVKFEDIIMKL